MLIRLTRKFSQSLNGVDISRMQVGDVIDLPQRDAELLVAEGWACPAGDDPGDLDLKAPAPRPRG